MLKYSPPLVQRGKATGRKIVRDAYAFDVDIPNRLIDIGVKRAVECVESMGADVIAAADHRRDEQRVIKVPRCAAELHKVAGQQPSAPVSAANGPAPALLLTMKLYRYGTPDHAGARLFGEA